MSAQGQKIEEWSLAFYISGRPWEFILPPSLFLLLSLSPSLSIYLSFPRPLFLSLSLSRPVVLSLSPPPSSSLSRILYLSRFSTASSKIIARSGISSMNNNNLHIYLIILYLSMYIFNYLSIYLSVINEKKYLPSSSLPFTHLSVQVCM